MIDMQRVEIIHELSPRAFLDRLAAVVTETQVDRRRCLHRVEHTVHRIGCPFPFFGTAWQVCLVHLNDVDVAVFHLRGSASAIAIVRSGRFL